MQQCLPLFHYSQPPVTSMESTCYNILTKKKRKKRNPKVMALPPTSANLLQHMLCAHLQIMLWTSANCEGTAGGSRDSTNLRWYLQIKIYIPVIAEGDPAPPELLDVIQCRARSVLRRFVDATSSTRFCNGHGGQDCSNQLTSTREISKLSEEDTGNRLH